MTPFILYDAPSIMFGFVMNIPDIKSDQERIKNQLLNPEGNMYEDIQPLVIIDSSKIKAQEIEILNYTMNFYKAFCNSIKGYMLDPMTKMDRPFTKLRIKHKGMAAIYRPNYTHKDIQIYY